MDTSSQIERVIITVNEFLQALDTRSWHAFEACFASSATVSLADASDDDLGVLPWQSIRQGWRQVFNAEFSRIGPLEPGRRRPLVELRGSTAFVSFNAGSSEQRAMILGLLNGRWLIRHLNVERLPLRHIARGTQTPEKRPSVTAASETPSMPFWFVPVLVAALVATALLGIASDRRSTTQLAAAVLAVAIGAVAVMRGQMATWVHSSVQGLSMRDIPLTSGGALGVAVGAAFLIT